MAATLTIATTPQARNARTNAYLDLVSGKSREKVLLQAVILMHAGWTEPGDVPIINNLFNLELIEARRAALARQP